MSGGVISAHTVLVGVALSAAAVAAPSSTAGQTEAGEAPGIGFAVDRYAVEIRPDLATKAVAGVETVHLRGTSDGLTRLAFTSNALRIGAATLDGAPVQVASRAGATVFTLARPLRRGERAELRFRFEGTPSRGVTVLPDGLYTSYFACDWMVCLQDSPGDKAHLTLDLLLPKGVSSVGVGRADRTVALDDGSFRHRWRSTRPYSPYLFAFAAGRFERSSVRTAAGELVYLDAAASGGQAASLLARSPAIAVFLADKAGMSFPDGRYVQILVPGDEAQETAGFSLIGRSVLEPEREDPAAAWAVAHEMAHQWWGNLVTCATWRDLWLDEGMATFMVAAWKERDLGEIAYRQELDVAQRRLDRARAAGFDKPLAWDGRYPSLSVRRAVQYSKGALFLAHLRQSTGDAAFWRGLRDFTRRRAGGTVTSRDFQRAMERSSGRDLSKDFDEWVYGAATREVSPT